MRSYSQLFLSLGMIVSLCGSLTNCGLSANRDNKAAEEAKGEEGTGKPGQDEADGKKEAAPPMRVVGEIASVHAAEKFVLIKRYFQAGGFGAGSLIASISPSGQACSLILTGERLGRYYAADIRHGSPQKGDVVVARELQEEREGPSTPLPKELDEQKKALWVR